MSRQFLKLAIICGLLIAASTAGAAASISGTWSGSGYVDPANGPRESVRCRITYSQLSKTVFSVKATCATTSVKIIQTGEVLMVNPSRYIGDFYSNQYDVSGRVRVIVKGSRQTVTFSSQRGRGRVTLKRR